MSKDVSYSIAMMSGTSLDGIDACMVKFETCRYVDVIETHSLNYPKEVKDALLNCANNLANTEDICFLNFVVGELFAQCANELIEKAEFSKDKIAFISSHGQTIFHSPYDRELGGVVTKSTLQIGDISVIAERTGITTAGDYRAKDVAAGGLGAPLVPFADEILFEKEKNRAIHNIGGISNVTVLSDSCDTFAFDCGPGNMLIDYYIKKFFDLPFDKDGEIAAQGKLDEDFLNQLLQEPFYSMIPPKTTGRELFSQAYAERMLEFAPENKYDLIATVTNLTAKTIYDAYVNFIFPKVNIAEIVLGGGGAYNKTLVNYLQEYFKEIPIITHEDFGISNKFKEAIAFAILGYYTIHKKFNNIPACTGAKNPVVMGKIAY